MTYTQEKKLMEYKAMIERETERNENMSKLCLVPQQNYDVPLDEFETQLVNSAAIAEVEPNSFEDHCFGIMMGAFIGNSVGSYFDGHEELVEFEQELDTASMMCGGHKNNQYKYGQGQITKDMELAMCNMWGLVRSNEMQNSVAHYYNKWVESPTDIDQSFKSIMSGADNN